MDNTQILFAVLNILLLIITAFVIWQSPIEAVKIGRKLNEEQEKRKAKMDLFLTLFAQRGTPVRQDFIDNLNKISVVFYDVQKVLDAWKEYLAGLSNSAIINQNDKIKNLRTNLLSQMASHLGYGNILQTEIQEPYYPEGQIQQEATDFQLRNEALKYLQSGNGYYQALAESSRNGLLSPNGKEEEV